MSTDINCHTLPIVITQMTATSCSVTPQQLMLIWSVRRSCDTDQRTPPTAAGTCLASVNAWVSGERECQTVVGAEAGLFESLPESLYSLLAATHSAVRTPVPVMGKT